MKRWAGMAMAAALCCGAPAWSASLPALDGAVADSPDERRLGEAFLRKLRASTPVLDDPLLQSWVEDICYRLAFHSGMARPDLQIVLIPDRRINAFAVPGGIIGINAGLFLHAANESEFAAVLAHELAHVQQRHYARSVENAAQGNWMYLGALLASIAIAASGGGDAGLAVSAGAQAAMIQQQLAYSRQHEREADRIGMQTLTAAGYTPQAMPSFFGRLERESRQIGFMPDFLLTHPLTQDRIADSVGRSRSLPESGTTDSRAYQLVRTRLIGLMAATDERALSAYRQQLKDDPSLEEPRLGLAMALKNLKQAEQARREMDILLKRDPVRVDFLIARADIELSDNRPDAALALLQQALPLTPDSTALRLYAAHAANLALRPELSIGWLEPLARQRPLDTSVWELLSEAYLQKQDSVGVLRTRAELRFLSGQGDKAVKDLEQAIRLSRDNYPMQSRLRDRLATIRERNRDERKVE